jgi:5'-3' exonuclease
MYSTEGILMILIDYSQVSLANILSFKKELMAGDEKSTTDLIRHATLSTIKSYKKKYGKDYGDVVICCDGRNYWRRQYFEHYKASRKKARDASDLDWGLIFDTLSKIRQEIIDVFPYKVMHLDQCEADDIIAVLTQQTQEFGFSENVMIVSSDKDFKQLHKFGNVKQYSPLLRKMITAKKSEIHENYITHIVKGDTGDGIPNILSKDDCFVTGSRQTPVSSKRLAEFMEKGIDACRNDEEKRNWQRNQVLVNFDNIPEDIKTTILETYLSIKPKGDKMMIMNYLIANRCRLLLDQIEEF